MYFEPVGKNAKCEEENRETKEEEPGQHTRREPDLTGERGNEIVQWESRIESKQRGQYDLERSLVTFYAREIRD